MGGDGKGPEHLALQPMYVDSNSVFNDNTIRSKSSGSDVSDAISQKPLYPYYRFNKNTKQPQGSAAYIDLIRYNTHSKSDERLNNSEHRSKIMHRPKSLNANVFTE